ncbi:MAG: hypothetical protein WC758_05535 [Candidatus Woesearchaeota archaeon]
MVKNDEKNTQNKSKRNKDSTTPTSTHESLTSARGRTPSKTMDTIIAEHRKIVNHATRKHTTYEFSNTVYGKTMAFLEYFKLPKYQRNIHRVSGDDAATKFVVGLNKGAGHATLDFVYSVTPNIGTIDRKIEVLTSLLGSEELKKADHGDLSENKKIYLKTLEKTYINFIERAMMERNYKK